MRNRAVWLAAALWIAVAGSGPGRAQVVQNLISNGGFETGDPSGWGVFGAAGAQVVTTCDGARIAENPVEGQYCLHVTVSAAGVNFWDSALQRHDLVFQKGKKYTLSAFFKCKAGTLKVNVKPELGANPWTGYGEQLITIGETWTEYHVTTPVFASDVSPAGIIFHIGFAAAEFWVDDIKWYEGDYVPTFDARQPGSGEPVAFPDPGVRDGIETRLGIVGPTPADLWTLDWVNLSNRAITDLTGLEYAKNLVRLDLWQNGIVDIAPLTSLTHLRVLTLYGNPLSAEACLIQIPVIRANNPGIMIQYDGWPEQQQTLVISSSPGGSVVMPGEGTLTLNYGQCVPAEAVANAGYQFTHWSGTAVDANMVLDPSAPHTSMVVEGDYSLTAHFKSQDLPWATVYFNDFEAQAGPEWSHNALDATPVGARRFLGQFGNDTVTLTVAGLPTHTHARLSFDLFIVRTWDGNQQAGHDPHTGQVGGGTVGPDVWKLEVAGPGTLLETSFANWPYYEQSYPLGFMSGSFPADTGASEVGTLRYIWEGWFAGQIIDSVYHLTFPFEHEGDQVSCQFSAYGLQTLGDESWGLDNVRVEVVDAYVELTTSSTEGGSVVMPGEGPFTYGYDKLAPVEAVAEEGYQFTHWSGTAIDANAMLDPCAPHTSVIMDANYSLVAHFKPQDQPWSTVYFNDFEGQVGPEWSHGIVDATPVGERRFLGQFSNDAVTLTLLELPSHSRVRLSFDLFVIRSWDGNGSVWGLGPDHWALTVEARSTLLNTTFDNHPYVPWHDVVGSGQDAANWQTQAFPGDYPEGRYRSQKGAAEVTSLGYLHRAYGLPMDAVYHIDLSCAHAGSRVSMNFDASGLQDLGDESWGLDNVRVEVLTPVSDVTLTVSSTARGSVTTPGDGQFKYPSGTPVPVQAVAEAGYHFTHWSGTAIDAGKVADPASVSTTVLMDGDYTLVANFAVNPKTLTVSATAGGSVAAPGEGTFQYAQGASVPVQAAAKAHYYFTHWSGTAVDAGKVADPASAGTSVTMDADYTLVANFRIDQHQLVVSAGAGGSIDVETRTGTITKPWYDQPVPPLDHGTEVTIVATPSDGWKFLCWAGTMGSTESPLTFELTDDCHLEAQFVPE